MRLQVGIKFASLSVLALLLIIATATLDLYEMRALSGPAIDLTVSAEASQYSRGLRFDLAALAEALASGIDQRNLAWFGQPTQERLEAIDRQMHQLSRVVRDGGDPQRATTLGELHAALRTESQTVIDLANRGQWNTAYLRLANYVDPASHSLEAQIDALDQQLDQRAAEVANRVREGRNHALRNVFMATCSALLLLGLATWLLWRSIVTPIRHLTESATLLASGQLAVRTHVAHRRDEIGTLSTAFDRMAAQLESSHHRLAEQVRQRTAELETERTALQQALADLQASTTEREQLLATVAQLQNPVIPVIDGVLVAPIVGQLHQQRLDLIQQTLLDAVMTTQARVVLLDITGVPAIDGVSAERLLQIGAGVRLLGATAVVVGIRPEVASQLIAQAINLDAIETAIDLQRGIDLALRRLCRQIVVSDRPMPVASKHAAFHHG